MKLNAENVYGRQMHFQKLDKICGIVVYIRKNDNAEESRNKLIAIIKRIADIRCRDCFQSDERVWSVRDRSRKIFILANIQKRRCSHQSGLHLLFCMLFQKLFQKFLSIFVDNLL